MCRRLPRCWSFPLWALTVAHFVSSADPTAGKCVLCLVPQMDTDGSGFVEWSELAFACKQDAVQEFLVGRPHLHGILRKNDCQCMLVLWRGMGSTRLPQI